MCFAYEIESVCTHTARLCALLCVCVWSSHEMRSNRLQRTRAWGFVGPASCSRIFFKDPSCYGSKTGGEKGGGFRSVNKRSAVRESARARARVKGFCRLNERRGNSTSNINMEIILFIFFWSWSFRHLLSSISS